MVGRSLEEIREQTECVLRWALKRLEYFRFATSGNKGVITDAAGRNSVHRQALSVHIGNCYKDTICILYFVEK